MNDIQVFKGEEKKLNYTITDDDDLTIDLTDKNVYFTVATEFPPYGEEVFEVKATNKKSNGTCDILLTTNETDITPKLYFLEVWVEFQGGEKYTAEIGRFFVRKKVNQ